MVTTSCAFHPDRETALSCTECDRPACPDCLTQMAVGQHCVGCTHGKPAAGEKGAAGFKVRKAVAGTDEHERLRRPSIAFYVILAVFLGSCVAAYLVPGAALISGIYDPNAAGTAAKATALAVVLSGAVLGLVFHEWAHAIVAYYGGDRSVADKGYLTLDVRHYSNPVLSIGMPIAFLLLGGLPLPGGAVWIRDDLLRTKWWNSAVSLAGPAVNFIGALAIYAVINSGLLGDHEVLAGALSFLAFIEVGIVILNLLPIPGLDGYGVIEPHLSDGIRRVMEPVKQWSMVILLVLIFGGGLQFIWDWNNAFTNGLHLDQDGLGAWGEQLASPRLFARPD